MNVPTKSEWKELIDAAITFRRLEPWKWMGDSELFGVQNPENGEIGYCVVMGGVGELYGLAIYRGPEGLKTIKAILSDRITVGDKAILNTDAYMVEYVNKSELEQHEKDLFKSIEYAPTGRLMYPVFRDYKSGYFPWFIDREGARFLSHVLHQAVDIARRLLDDEELLIPPKTNEYLIRVPFKQGNSIVWEDEWKNPAPVRTKRKQSYTADTTRCTEIMHTVKHRGGILELDSFYNLETVIDAEPRPYFANVIFAVDHNTGYALHHAIARPDNYAGEMQNVLFDVIEKRGAIPEKILVRNNEIAAILSPVTEPLRTTIQVQRKLKVFDKLKKTMGRFFR